MNTRIAENICGAQGKAFGRQVPIQQAATAFKSKATDTQKSEHYRGLTLPAHMFHLEIACKAQAIPMTFDCAEINPDVFLAGVPNMPDNCRYGHVSFEQLLQYHYTPGPNNIFEVDIPVGVKKPGTYQFVWDDRMCNLQLEQVDLAAAVLAGMERGLYYITYLERIRHKRVKANLLTAFDCEDMESLPSAIFKRMNYITPGLTLVCDVSYIGGYNSPMRLIGVAKYIPEMPLIKLKQRDDVRRRKLQQQSASINKHNSRYIAPGLMQPHHWTFRDI